MDATEIEAAQTSWGHGLVQVGAAASWDEAHRLAVKLVEDHYYLEDASLLFCPTRAARQQFRSTREAAVSYFVGRNPDHVEDRGFALEPWVSVRFENAGIVCHGEMGLAMGNYYFRRQDGSELKAEFSLVYRRDQESALKIQLHHSALPYGDGSGA